MVKIAIVVKHDGDEYLPILKQGVHIWNKWREDNPRATLINFSGVYINISELDLRGANLTRINFNEANLCKTDLRNTELGLSTLEK